jgi:4-hydroxy-2-oxoheptanedioate aldolase
MTTMAAASEGPSSERASSGQVEGYAIPSPSGASVAVSQDKRSLLTPASLRERWNDGVTTLGAWMFFREPLVAEVAGDAGYDYVCIDMQHGLADYANTVAMLQGLSRTAATPIVRVPWNEPAMIGRVLDAGALGVIIPMVNSADEAAQAVAACRYAPIGKRSLGPIGAMVRHGNGYFRWANERVACLPMIETIEAVENIDEILQVPGIDAIYVGPADLSLTLGLPPLMDNVDEKFQNALSTIIAACQRHGVVAGIQASTALAETRAKQGFQMITVGYDQAPVVAALRGDLAASRTATTLSS